MLIQSAAPFVQIKILRPSGRLAPSQEIILRFQHLVPAHSTLQPLCHAKSGRALHYRVFLHGGLKETSADT